ncbi:MAG TPA: FecR domain-containing protein [Arachidicoccus sp.]
MQDPKIEEAIYIASLIKKERENVLSDQEKTHLEQWKNRSDASKRIYADLKDLKNFKEGLLKLEAYDYEQQIQKLSIAANINEQIETSSEAKIVQIKRKKYYLRTAIAAMVLIALGVYLNKYSHNRITSLQQKNIVRTNNVIVPGGNHAVLTLADGKKIILDTASDGLLNKDINIAIMKSGDAVLTYSGTIKNGVMTYNSISTPRGGQYQLMLADGTKVWLNAASGLKYPVAFTGKYREVTLEGEAYFEVMKNKKKPFVVNVNGMKVKVYGTHFNVMAYADEAAIKTTLLEGSVMVNNGADSVLIKPGQQAIDKNSNSKMEVRTADIDEELAWTKGEFLFRSISITEIMKQVARWYDADVHFDGDMSGILFSGGMRRQQSIRELLEILEADQRIKFVIKDRLITVERIKK